MLSKIINFFLAHAKIRRGVTVGNFKSKSPIEKERIRKMKRKEDDLNLIKINSEIPPIFNEIKNLTKDKNFSTKALFKEYFEKKKQDFKNEGKLRSYLLPKDKFQVWDIYLFSFNPRGKFLI